MPLFLIYGGFLSTVNYDPDNHVFRLEIKPQENLEYRLVHGDAVGRITVEFKASRQEK